MCSNTPYCLFLLMMTTGNKPYQNVQSRCRGLRSQWWRHSGWRASQYSCVRSTEPPVPKGRERVGVERADKYEQQKVETHHDSKVVSEEPWGVARTSVIRKHSNRPQWSCHRQQIEINMIRNIGTFFFCGACRIANSDRENIINISVYTFYIICNLWHVASYLAVCLLWE